MPLKLSVGFARKHGLPDYSSIGATCSVEVELDSALLQDDLDEFQRRARHAYVACRQAVQDELAHHCDQGASPASDDSRPVSAPRSNGNDGHRASEKQLNYINQLAGQISGLGTRRLESLCQKMFGKPVADLTSLNGSALIDTLKAIKDGQINLEDALNGATT